MSAPTQAALPFPHRPLFHPADFIPGSANAAALAWLAEPHTWPGHRLALHGPPGSGKTHLLHVFAARHGIAVAAGPALCTWDPAAPAVALDDANRVPDPDILLHLLNAAAERAAPVLLAAREPPARWPTALADLRSRLRAVTAAGLAEPDDALLRALLARLLAERQLAVAQPVQDWLLARLPRTGAALRDAAARLDAAALAEGRRITRDLAARTLDLAP